MSVAFFRWKEWDSSVYLNFAPFFFFFGGKKERLLVVFYFLSLPRENGKGRKRCHGGRAGHVEAAAWTEESDEAVNLGSSKSFCAALHKLVGIVGLCGRGVDFSDFTGSQIMVGLDRGEVDEPCCLPTWLPK